MKTTPNKLILLATVGCLLPVTTLAFGKYNGGGGGKPVGSFHSVIGQSEIAATIPLTGSIEIERTPVYVYGTNPFTTNDINLNVGSPPPMQPYYNSKYAASGSAPETKYVDSKNVGYRSQSQGYPKSKPSNQPRMNLEPEISVPNYYDDDDSYKDDTISSIHSYQHQQQQLQQSKKSKFYGTKMAPANFYYAIGGQRKQSSQTRPHHAKTTRFGGGNTPIIGNSVAVGIPGTMIMASASNDNHQLPRPALITSQSQPQPQPQQSYSMTQFLPANLINKIGRKNFEKIQQSDYIPFVTKNGVFGLLVPIDEPTSTSTSTTSAQQ